MALEQEPPKRHNPLELLEGKNYVVAETFIIRTDNSSNKKLGDDVYRSLSGQGITDFLLFDFCNSKEEQVRKIINSLEGQKFARGSDDPRMFVVGFNADQLQEIFNAISVMIIEKDPILEDIEGKNITILQLNAPSNSTFIDKRTGLKIAVIKKRGTCVPNAPDPRALNLFIPTMKRFMNIPQLLICDMGIDLGGGNIFVPEHFLNRS